MKVIFCFCFGAQIICEYFDYVTVPSFACKMHFRQQLFLYDNNNNNKNCFYNVDIFGGNYTNNEKS